MNKEDLKINCIKYMNQLCSEITERSVGSPGNIQATEYFHKQISSFGWETTLQEFNAMDWKEDGASLIVDNESFKILVSPYSLGFSGKAILASASNVLDLKKEDFSNKILLLHSDIAKEQLMPKNFVFYNPAEHQEIIALLEKSKVKAIVCATGRNSSLAGGVYPFPLIEDGDFDIPSVYMTEEESKNLFKYVGKPINLTSNSQRIPAKGYNVVARFGKPESERIVITAHIDAKKGTPGAIDNATGVATLLLLAELLKDYSGNFQIEIVAFNGEDYYAVPGQMKYLMENQEKFSDILMNINIDGLAYKNSEIAFSLFELPVKIKQIADQIINKYPNIKEGYRWVQGDHSIFLQYGRPAIAISSKWFIDNIDNQDITHTEKDNLDIVDYNMIIETAIALNEFIRKL